MRTVEQIRTIVAERSRRPVSDIEPYSRFKDDLGLNSLDVIEIVIDVQRQTGVAIPEKESGFESVGELVDYVVPRVR
ncbi:acyl carrier protein [Nocardia sp. NPDC050712]|uniref:acyl carrier protein n=1 Tax=Nocardia sp. NPDC050712 TaxID=3155518 RepID=UPI0033E6A5B8